MVMYADRDTDIAIYGTHVTFTCHLGYQYPDKETRKNKTCEDSGSWSHILPDCEGGAFTTFHPLEVVFC